MVWVVGKVNDVMLVEYQVVGWIGLQCVVEEKQGGVGDEVEEKKDRRGKIKRKGEGKRKERER